MYRNVTKASQTKWKRSHKVSGRKKGEIFFEKFGLAMEDAENRMAKQ